MHLAFIGETANYSTHEISVKENSRRKPSTLSNIKAATLEKMLFDTEQLVTSRNVYPRAIVNIL